MDIKPTVRRTSPSKSAQRHVSGILETLNEIQDPTTRAWVMGLLLDNETQHRIRRMRAEAVEKLRDEGKTWEQVASLLGVSRERAVAIASVSRPSNPSNKRRKAGAPVAGTVTPEAPAPQPADGDDW